MNINDSAKFNKIAPEGGKVSGVSNDVLLERIDNLSNEVEKIGRAVAAFTRLEERMLGHADGLSRLGNRIDRQDEKQADFEKRLTAIEVDGAKKSSVIAMLERLAWIGVTTALAFWFGSK